MTRSVCCLALTCLVAACAPPKAALVEETPVPRQSKPRPRATGEETPVMPPQFARESGMQVPDLTRKLPDKKDMTPTAAPATGAGSTVIATPPTE